MRIDSADLAKTVEGILNEYGSDVSEAVGKAVESTATDAVKELKSTSRSAGFDDKTYSRGWTKKVTKHRLYSEATVYNRTSGHLTHLLEFGHAKVNGGRTRAFPHIAPVNDKVEGIFSENFEDALNA